MWLLVSGMVIGSVAHNGCSRFYNCNMYIVERIISEPGATASNPKVFKGKVPVNMRLN